MKRKKRRIKKSPIRKFWSKFWFLLWKDDSLKGWVFALLFIFVFIKFIFFPALNLITGTTLPLAIVESCSMYHSGGSMAPFANFDSWYTRHNDKYSDHGIIKDKFENFIFKNGFNKGDILFVIRATPENLKIGDVIIFNAERQHPLIHRIINIEGKNDDLKFSTLGDNNPGQLSVEKNIEEDQLVGKAIFKIAPLVGWGKLVFFDWRKTGSERGFCNEN